MVKTIKLKFLNKKQKNRFLSIIVGLCVLISCIGLINEKAYASYSYTWPVSTSYGINCGFYGYDGHGGVDFPVGIGTPVYAIAAGTVTVYDRGCTGSHYTGSIQCSKGTSCAAYQASPSYYGAYANYITINHGNGMVSYYCHLSTGRMTVKTGDYVSQGQIIGYSGTAGYTTGPHLHLEMRLNGTQVNPESYLSKVNVSSESSTVTVPAQKNYPVKNGTYCIRNAGKGYQMNVYGGTDADGTKVVGWSWDGSTEQKFRVYHENNGAYWIYAMCSSGGNGRVLDINVGGDNTLGIGDYLDIWSRGSYNNCQLFNIVPVGNNQYVFELASMDNVVLTLTSENNNAAITLQRYTGSNLQKWYFCDSSKSEPTIVDVSTADTTPPVIKDIKITNLSSKGYTVTCTVTDNVAIDRVQFPTWTEANGQDDIQANWKTNTAASGSISGNTVTYRVNVSDHKNETGSYNTHIYAYDKAGNQTSAGTKVVVPNGIVPVKVDTYNNHIYAYFSDCYTWKEAKTICENMGGHLVTITSKEENEFVKKLTNGNYAYIGCTDEEKEGTWKWITGESFNYSNWSSGEPNNSNNEEHFGEIKSNGTWNDNKNNGGYSRGFVLEIDGELKAANEVTANNYLYRAYDVSMPWEVAKVYCEKYGGSLAVPTNDAENTTIKNLIQNTKKSYYFLGITDKAKEDQWVDINGNVISYNKWGSEEPNGGISENYIVIGRNEKWNDTRSYDDFKGFIYQTQIAVTGITLNKTSLTLTEGGSETLQATIQPSNATNKTITWSSSNTSVATVDSAGKVTAVKAGTATITATSNNGKKVNCTVTVNAKTVAVTGITLNKTSVTLNVGGSETLQATIQPSNATNKTVTWSSSNTSVATVDSAGKVTAVKAGTATITATSNNSKKASCTVTVVEKQPSVSYTAHVQNTGWQSFVKDGGFAGTEGKSYRVEGIIVKLDAGSYTGGIKYRSYIQGIGWQDYVNNGSMTGTNGQSKRLEAIQIELTGDIAKYYDVYYTVHAQNYGWLGWAKNGETSGTVGYGYRLEGIMIKLVKKGDTPPSNGNAKLSYEQSDRPFINYMTYVQNEGWKESVRNGGFSGSSGKAQRIESIIMNVDSTSVSGGIRYRAMIQGNSNWTAYAADGAACGTSGQSKRLEAVQIELTGDLANKYDVYYRVYVENRGWMGWAKNGQTSGSIGYNARIEAIQIQPVVKGGAAPGSTANASVKK